MKIRCVLVCLIFSSGCFVALGTAHASVFRGSFSGIIDGSNTLGTDSNGVALASLAGLTITGTFSFDAGALVPAGGGLNFTSYDSPVPFTMLHDVGGQHYEFFGVLSQMFMSENWGFIPNSYLFQLAVSGPPGDPLPNAVLSAFSSIPLFSDIDDPSTILIDGHNFQLGVGQDQFGEGDTFLGMLTFSVTRMQVTAVAGPSSLLLTLTGLGSSLIFVARTRQTRGLSACRGARGTTRPPLEGTPDGRHYCASLEFWPRARACPTSDSWCSVRSARARSSVG